MKKSAMKIYSRRAALFALMPLILAGCGRNSSVGTDTNDLVVTDGSEGNGSDVMGNGSNDNGGNTASETMSLPALNIIDDKFRTTYEIFVYSFCDSNGDGIGDLKGITSKLDYINDGDDSTDIDLGCNEIWLMPVSPSTTYHKYDVTDYKDIDPEYGTLADFDELVNACHERGVRVIIDTVFNHSSVEHPWFTQAAEYLKGHPGIVFADNNGSDGNSSAGNSSATAGNEIAEIEECPYLDYYIFSNEKMDGFEPVQGTDYFYEARFWSGMPDLNLDSQKVRDELSGIMSFWLDHGVDGFRLDATTYYYTGDDGKNTEFLTWLNDTAKQRSDDVYIVGEAWTNSATYTKYYKSGIDSFFDFDFAGSEGIIAGVAKGTAPASRYGEALVKNQELLKQSSDTAIDAPFYTNHDMARAAGYFTGKEAYDRLKLSAALNLLMPGNAFIYYGEELGMKGSGKDENKRAPMYWTAGEAPYSDGAPSWLTDLDKSMCKGPKDMESFKMKYPALDEQYSDQGSIYNYYKNAIRIRNTYPCIARGTTEVIEELSDSDICAFVRSMDEDAKKNYTGTDLGPESLLIVINTANEPKEVNLHAGLLPSGEGEAASYGTLSYQLNTADGTGSISDGILELAPFGVCILEK